MKIGIGFISFLLLIGWWTRQDIDVTLQVDPNPSPYISDWESDPTIASLTIQSLDQQPLELSLEAELTENSLGLIGQAQSQMFALEPNDLIQIDCAELLVNESVQYNTDLEEQIVSTGRIPEGDYQICIHVFQEPSHQLIQTICQPFFIQQISPPTLIYPVSEEIAYNQFTTFQWQPIAGNQPIQYSFKLVGLLENQTPAEAIEFNNALVEEFTSEAEFPIDWSVLDIDLTASTAEMAWQVQALDFNNNPVGENEGFSTVESFQLNISTNTPNTSNITILTPSNKCVGEVGLGHTGSSIEVKFEVTGDIKNVYLLITTNTCGKYTPAISNDPTITPPTTTTTGQSLTHVPTQVLNELQQWYVEPYEVMYASPKEVISHPQQGTSAVYTMQVPIGEVANPGDAYTVFVAGVESQNIQGVTMSNPKCDRYSPLNPTTNNQVNNSPCKPPLPQPQYCNIKPEEKKEPAMAGGLNEAFLGKQIINRDDFVALGALGQDFDTFIYDCIPGEICKKVETPSKETLILSSRVKFEWEIQKGSKGSFKKIGCLPESLGKDVGDHVIFQPPYVPLPKEEEGSKSITTKITLKIIDDNGTQPDDGTLTKEVVIETKRYAGSSSVSEDQYEVIVSGESFKLGGAPAAPKATIGLCEAKKTWKPGAAITKPVHKFPAVTDGSKMAVGQWMRLETNDIRDTDKLITICDSKKCTDTKFEKDYQDHIQWKWSVSKSADGGFKTASGKTSTVAYGQYVIYEAPLKISKPFIDVTITVSVTDEHNLKKSVQSPDAEKKHKFKVRVYQAGVKLQQTPTDWLPDTTTVDLESKLMYRADKKNWKDGFAHMCRIHFFNLFEESNETGMANNFPQKDKANQCPDLRIEEQDELEVYAIKPREPHKICSDLDKYLVDARTKEPENKFTIEIRSEDYAAFGKLVSWANKHRSNRGWDKKHGPLYWSVPLTLRERTHPSKRLRLRTNPDNRVTIPRDVDENHVADNWHITVNRVKKYLDPVNLKEDIENVPRGDGAKGDGLSIFEEYRGFITSKPNIHVRSNPRHKNVFIVNKHELDWSMFQSAFKYKVYELNHDLVHIPRVWKTINDTELGHCFVNFNRSRGYNHDQAGIILFDGNGTIVNEHSNYGWSLNRFNTKGPLGPPNTVYGAMINVENIKTESERLRFNNDVKLKNVIAHELGHSINTYHHGEAIHSRSGNKTCLMRYDNSHGEKEDIATSLCTLANRNNNIVKRFGKPRTGRGGCASQHRISCNPKLSKVKNRLK